MQIGVALSGGGQKSAPFEMGVLAGLSQTGVLAKVDVISSVSGGSYAALFYYTRIAERYDPANVDHSPFDEIFLDCLPRTLRGDFTDTYEWNSVQETGLCPDSHPPRNYWVPGNSQLQGDPLRFASQVRGSQALFAHGWSYRDRTKFPVVIWPISQDVIYGAIDIFPFGAVRLVTDSVFDWDLNPDFAFARYLYNRGIDRAYGATAAQEPTGRRKRPQGTETAVQKLTFPDLRDIYLKSHRPNCIAMVNGFRPCNVPLWVINTTAGTSISPFVLTEPDEFDGATNTFEFSPFGYGSGAYGYAKWQPDGSAVLQPSIKVVTAVGASAAFFDSQQRTMGWLLDPGINILQRWLNFDWGKSIPNYNLTASQYHRARFFHFFLPWPFYLFHRHAGDVKALRIHLSDGGMSEDLGVWALLRRHVSQIIVVDASTDDHYQMDDMCHLYLQLSKAQNQPLYIYFESPQLKEFAEVCRQEQLRQAPDDPFKFKVRGNWPAPVLKAWVCNASKRLRCKDKHILATLYIIKPMLNWTAKPGSYSLTDSIASGGPRVSEKQCSIPTSAATSTGYPCEVLSYLASSGHRGSSFPQDSTVWVSAISSPYIYGAYRDLGLYYAKALRVQSLAGGEKQLQIDYSGYWNDDEGTTAQR
ncbi:MAG TPA: patatin-like phospholipase family protein [Steroidobacteraceae bacterium]|nr:patatin-like phospholipase family protein [Steroidobacteraceae bacterium]